MIDDSLSDVHLYVDVDSPTLSRDVVHAQIGSLLCGLRETLDSLIAIRVREFGMLLQHDEVELMKIKNSLDWLLSDLRESRLKVARFKR